MAKIVIIDDDFIILESLKEILISFGFDVFATDDGWTGVDYVKENKTDLIICDIEMPTITGYEVLKVIKSDINLVTIPFIFLTGLNTLENQRQGMLIGADDYLTKPFKTQELIEAINVRLERKNIIDKSIEKNVDSYKNLITSTLPHELNTPLNGIMGSAQMLIEGSEDFAQEEIQELYRVIYYSANRLKNLISNFIYINELETRSKSENPQVNKVDVDTKTLVSEYSKKQAISHGRENDLILDVKDFNLKINENDLIKIVSEIVDNAFKFSPERSKVIVSTSVDDKLFTLRVIDYGRGLNQDQLESLRIFKQFDRDTIEQQGLGLGLEICKNISSLWNAKFEIRSNQNEFTEISIHFPIIN